MIGETRDKHLHRRGLRILRDGLRLHLPGHMRAIEDYAAIIHTDALRCLYGIVMREFEKRGERP